MSKLSINSNINPSRVGADRTVGNHSQKLMNLISIFCRCLIILHMHQMMLPHQLVNMKTLELSHSFIDVALHHWMHV